MQESEVIEVRAGEIPAELQRRGIDGNRRIMLVIERETFPGRSEARARVIAAGLTDEDIDRLIKQAQKEVAQQA